MSANSLYSQVLEKFIDKGMWYEFHILVGSPAYYIDQGTNDLKVVGYFLDYWNTWIDYQNAKF